MSETITGFKGFDKDLKCRDYQYEVGKEFEEEGKIEACSKGFHFCENPFDVLGYYPPSTEKGSSRYCIVKGSGNIDRDGDDSKVACSKLHISAEIGLKGIIEAGVKFILDKVNWKDNKESNTGNQSAATNTGNYSAAEVTGKESIAIVTGKDSKAKGGIGCWIVLTERGEWDDNVYPIKEVKAVRVDGEIIKPDTYYKLIDGEVIPCE
nr:MAG TPA: hypothetical protein [Caudoviricetes sp.]